MLYLIGLLMNSLLAILHYRQKKTSKKIQSIVPRWKKVLTPSLLGLFLLGGCLVFLLDDIYVGSLTYRSFPLCFPNGNLDLVVYLPSVHLSEDIHSLTNMNCVVFLEPVYIHSVIKLDVIRT
jgi:hypothetical protein